MHKNQHSLFLVITGLFLSLSISSRALAQVTAYTGATVIAVVRDSVAMYTRDPDSRFEIDDTVVLVGDREALEKALPLFRAPRT